MMTNHGPCWQDRALTTPPLPSICIHWKLLLLRTRPRPTLSYLRGSFPEMPTQVYPPGSNDLEILQNLKEQIKAGQHDFFRAVPQPQALAAIYLGPNHSANVSFRVFFKGVEGHLQESDGTAFLQSLSSDFAASVLLYRPFSNASRGSDLIVSAARRTDSRTPCLICYAPAYVYL